MCTPSERLEAEIWIEANSSDMAPEVKERFFAGVHEYYTQYPIADRRPDVAAILREDDEAFTLILRTVLAEDESRAAAVDVDLSAPSANCSRTGVQQL